MEFVVEDKDGRVLGSRDLEGSRWEQVGDHFENLQTIAVEIAVRGTFGDMYIKNGNQRICSDPGNNLGILEVGSNVLMAERKVTLGYHERHAAVWDAPASRSSEFTRDTIEELRTRADVFQIAIAHRKDVPADVQSLGQALLATIYDLLAVSS